MNFIPFATTPENVVYLRILEREGKKEDIPRMGLYNLANESEFKHKCVSSDSSYFLAGRANRGRKVYSESFSAEFSQLL